MRMAGGWRGQWSCGRVRGRRREIQVVRATLAAIGAVASNRISFLLTLLVTQMAISASGSICASRSSALGVTTTAATAGTFGSFTIQAKDQYGQIETQGTEAFVVGFSRVGVDEGTSLASSSFSVQTLVQPGTIHGVTIAAGGSSCTAGGTLSASVPSGQGGSGFAATFTVSGGAIDAVTVTDQGDGYTATPTISIASGGTGCTGFTLTPEFTLLGEHYGHFVTTVSGTYAVSPVLLRDGGLNASYYSNLWLHGTPDTTRVDEKVDFDWGMGALSAGAADRASIRWEGVLAAPMGVRMTGTVPRGGVWRVDVLKPGSGCSADGTLSASGGGGGTGFEATFQYGTVPDVDGSMVSGIVGVTVTRMGSGYTSEPTLAIATGGTGCAGQRLMAVLSTAAAMETVFSVITDGAARLWIDNVPVIDQWSLRSSSAVSEVAQQRCASPGNVTCAAGSRTCSAGIETIHTLSTPSGGFRVVTTNACPPHAWAPSRTAHKPLSQSIVASLPSAPTISSYPVNVGDAQKGASSHGAGVIGFAVDGVPIYGPSRAAAADGSLDACGGHADSVDGTYHYHLDPVCAYNSVAGQHSPLVGFMIDGVPLYGLQDVGGSEPELDECGGHVDEEHPFYHYHTSRGYPYTVSCLRGCVPSETAATEGVLMGGGICVPGTRQYDYSSLSRVERSVGGDAQARAALNVNKAFNYVGSFAMVPGSLYPFKLEYRHQSGPASIKLMWAPGLGNLTVVDGFKWSSPLTACGDLPETPCGHANLTVQAGALSAAACVFSPLQNLVLNTSTVQGGGIPPQFNPLVGTFGLGWSSSHASPNYISRAGALMILVSSRDAFGNARDAGGDTFAVDAFQMLHAGKAQRGSTSQIVLSEGASSEDAAYLGMFVDITGGTGSGQRVEVTRYIGSTRTALGTFATAPDPSSTYVVGPVTPQTPIDLKNGSYQILTELTVSANYSMWVRSGGDHISGSPFYISVAPAAFDASASTISIPYVWTSGEPSSLIVVAKDRFGNNISSSDPFPAYSDTCTSGCAPVRFSTIVKSTAAISRTDVGSIAAANTASSFTLGSTASTGAGLYVGLAINIGGYTRNITHHGATASSSAAAGRVVTVDTAFPVAPSVGDAYFVTKFSALVPATKRVCKMSDEIDETYKASCAPLMQVGEYTVEVASAGVALKESPVKFVVHPSWKCASQSIAYGMGLTLATAAAAASFTIATRDSFGQASTRGGDAFSVTADRPGSPSLQYFSYCSPSMACVSSSSGTGTISDRNTGTYGVSFTPTRSGRYSIDVRLGPVAKIQSSPYDLVVKAGTMCATKSRAYGPGLTIATTGVQTRFTVVARDAYDNEVDFMDKDTVTCGSGGGAGACKLTLTVGTQVETRYPRDDGYAADIYGVTPGWDVAYMVDRSFSTYNVTTTLSINGENVGNIVGGGLFATYYNGDILQVPMIAQAEEAAIDFSGTGFGGEYETGAWPWQGDVHRSLQATGTCLVADDAFSVRWAGFLSGPKEDTQYTFTAKMASDNERLKLWVDNSLLIEQWTSRSVNVPTATYSFNRGYEMYDIQMDYTAKSPASSRRASLFWSNKQQPVASIIPPSMFSRRRLDFTTLVLSEAVITGGLSTVQQGGTSASLSLATGNGLSTATAGGSGYFTITAKDNVAATAMVAEGQIFSFSAKAGSSQGGLLATYYSDGASMSAQSSTRVDEVINFAGGTTTLSKALRVPTPADPALVVQLTSAAALGTAVGSHISIGSEVMAVNSIDGDELTVVRARAATTASAHDKLATVLTVQTSTLPSATGYSARWAGLSRPEFAGEYTFYAGVQQADERVKLWVDGQLLVDQWSSIGGLEVSATWESMYAGGYYDIKVEYRNQEGIDGATLSWEATGQAKAIVTSERLFQGISTVHGLVGDARDGTYRVMHTVTHAAAYQTFVGLHTVGGLQATYYSDTDCFSSAIARDDETIDFDWDVRSPHPSVPENNICVRWAGWIKPEYTGVYTFGVRADDSASLWLDSSEMFDKTVEGAIEEWSATKQMTADVLYPIKVEYREFKGKASAELKWSTQQMLESRVSSLEFAPRTCSDKWGALELPRSSREFECLSTSGHELSGGRWYLPGDFEVLGSAGGNARGTFTVDSYGAVNGTHIISGGAAYPAAPAPSQVSLYYPGTTTVQEGTVTSVVIDTAGSNYVKAVVKVTGGSTFAWGQIRAASSGGAVTTVEITDHGSGFGLPLSSSNVLLLYPSSFEPMSGSVTSISVSGTMTGAYDADGTGTVTCTGGCAGTGLEFTCSIRGGSIDFLVITAHGSGYTQADPPTLACPGGTGQTLTANVAEGAVLSPRVAVGATLQANLAGGRIEIVPSSRLYRRTDPVDGWGGTDDFQVLTVDALAVCGTTSTVSYGGVGWADGAATVGNPASFTIQARDEYGNVRAGPDGTATSPDDFFVARLYYEGEYEVMQYEGSGVSATAGVTGQYTFSIAAAEHTRAGVRELHAGLAIQGGLFATYYSGANFSAGSGDPTVWPDSGVPASVVEDVTVDFSQAANTASTAAQTWPSSPKCLVEAVYPFKARWAGFWKQSSGTATYTFSMTLGQAEERVRLWVGNSLLIDQWTSLDALTPAGASASYTVNVPYSVEVEYKVRGGGLRTVKLQTTTGGGAATVIPSGELFRSYDLSWPGAYRSQTANATRLSMQGSNSLLSGNPLTIATAGTTSSFTITARDAYNNLRGSRKEGIRVSLTQAGIPAVHASVSGLATPGEYVASYRLTSSGTHTISVATPLSGGLHATYFSSDDFTDGRYIRVDSMAPMRGTGDASSTSDWPGDVNQALDGTAFSVRWEGFVKPQVPGAYQFAAAIGDADNRIKVWIDNSIIIEQWLSLAVATEATGTFFFGSADTYYDFKIDYKEVTGGAQAMELKWSLAPTTSITIEDRGCFAGCAGTTAAVSTVGEWLQIAGVGLDSTISTDGNAYKGTKTFVYTYPEAYGVLTVAEYHPASGTYATNTPLNITHSSGTSQFYIDQTADGSAYNTVARLCFRSSAVVTIGTLGTTATVVADGIRFTRDTPATETVIDCGNFVYATGSARSFLLGDSASSERGAYVNKFLWIGTERRNIYEYDNKRQATVDQVFSMGTTTITASITSAATTITFTDPAGAGIIVGREVEVDYEIIYISADLGGNAFTVIRARQDTEAAAHEALAAVRTVLRPGQVVESGVVAASSALNKVTLATTAPTTVDVFLGSLITVMFAHGAETRTITGYTNGRVATVNPPFSESPVPSTSTYAIVLQSVYAVTEEPLRAEDGSVCSKCSLVPSLLYSAPRTTSDVSISVGVEREVVATGAELALATAGVAASFTVTVKDIYGATMSYDAGIVVFANLTLLTSTYGYGTIKLSAGLVATAGDAYTFTLDEAAPAEADAYLGFLIKIGQETRTIVSYTAGRVVNVNVPFQSAPTTTSTWAVSAEEQGHEWFPSYASFSASSSVANPSTVSYTATAAGLYRVEVNAHKVGGLQGNYYHNIYLQGQPSLTRVDESVNFDWGTGKITGTARSFVGIRWTGLVKAIYSETYTFVTNTTGFGPKLAIGGNVLVSELTTDHGCREWDPARNCLFRAPSWKWNWDGSSTGDQGAYLATIAMTAGEYYDILVDYRHRTGSASVQLYWMSPSQTLEVVPSTRLYYAFQAVTGSPLTLKVDPSPTFCSESDTYTTDDGLKCTTCGSSGSLMGPGLTLATAGVSATFNLQVKDQYGNLQTTATAMAFSRVESDPSCGAAGSGSTLAGNCSAAVATTPTQVQVGGLNKFTYTTNVNGGTTLVSSGLLTVGGLFATYYSSCSQIVSTDAKVGSGIRGVNITTMGSGCTAGGTISAQGGGGGATGFSATFQNRGGSVAEILVLNAGRLFDSAPSLTCCGMVYDVTFTGTGSGYTDGGALGVSCTGGCTGSGLAGTCTVVAGAVTAVVLTERGYGYDSANPPTLTCATGTGQTFTPSIDASTGGSGCLGVSLTPVMQFESSGETWFNAEARTANPWYESDIASSGATLTGCAPPVPWRVRLDPTVDFSGAATHQVSDWPGTANSLQQGDNFQVRWSGFVKPAGTGEYTFTSVVQGVDERIKLWVDNSMLIDEWTSLSALSKSGTYNLATTTYYPISVQYRDLVSTQKAQLQWEGAGDGPGIIASTALFAAFHAVGSPSPVNVRPSVPCSTLSTSRGIGLSLATAGAMSYFTVTAKDEFGNTRQTFLDEAKGYMYTSTITPSSSLKNVMPSVADSGDGIPVFSYNCTTAGTLTLSTYVAQAGGLHATYFDTDSLTSGLYIRQDATVDWSGTGDAASTTEWPGATGESVDGASFSVKWRGFVRAPYANTYTFTAKLDQEAGDDGERVKLWIDNSIVIEQWASLAVRSPTGTFYFEKREFLYEIVADYKHVSGPQQMSLYWQSDGSLGPALACDFTQPIAQPPSNRYLLSAYHVDMCGWNVESACDSGNSVCGISQSKTSSGDAQFTTLTGAPGFGTSVAWCGDMDGDGVEDLVAGAPGDDGSGTDSGAIYILLLTTSGGLKTSNLATGVSYRKIADSSYFAGCTSCLAANDLFGSQVAVFPDTNADGMRNLAVASLGSVWWLYMAPDTTTACIVCPPQATSKVELDVSGTIGSVVPTALAIYRDTEDDGVKDLLVGNSASSDGAFYIMGLTSTSCAGSAAICLTGTVTEISNGNGGFTGSCTGGSCMFGSSISLVGDVNGDGFEDLAVGARADDCGGTDRGAVYILMMMGTSVVTQVKICSSTSAMPTTMITVDGSLFGSSVAGVGDINGDGVPDIAVGSPKEAAGFKGAIYYIMLTRAGTVQDARLVGGPSDFQFTQAADQSLGYAIAAKIDHNRDGMGPDIASGNALEGSALGTVSVLLSAGWTKWQSGGNPVGGTPTASTGPASAMSGSYTRFSTGKRCNDGTRFLSQAGSTLNGEYSLLFSGTDAACATRCTNDALCNFYTTGASDLCETARSCRREDVSSDTTTVTYQKDSFLFLDSQYVGDSSDAGETYFTSRAGLYTELVFWYHMYGAAMGSLTVQIRSHWQPIASGTVSAVTGDPDTAKNTFTLDSNAATEDGAYVGYYIAIGSEYVKVASYSSARVVVTATDLNTAPTTSSVYYIYKLLSTCGSPSQCGEALFWEDLWSVSGQQQAADTDAWLQKTLDLRGGYAMPFQVRFKGVRGTGGATSDMALDRISLVSANTRLYTTSAVTRSKRQAYQIIPSNRLYMGLHTASSPFTLYVRPDITDVQGSLCASTGCDATQTLSAAATETVSVTLRDIYGNPRTAVQSVPGTLYNANHEDGLVVYLESQTEKNMRLYASVALNSGSQYDATFQPSGLDETATQRTFASSLLYVQLAKAGGLNATFYRDAHLALPLEDRVEETIDFSCTEAPVGTTNVPKDFFSIRWRGLVRAPAADETVTFKSTTSTSADSGSGKEGVRLWVSGLDTPQKTLLIDQWDGLDTSYEATVGMLTSRLYDIVVEYRDTQSTSSMKLEWKSASLGGTYAVIPSESLYYDNSNHFSSPFTVTTTA